jgi:hypothetical protein
VWASARLLRAGGIGEGSGREREARAMHGPGIFISSLFKGLENSSAVAA